MLLDKGVNDGLAALEVSQAEGVGAVDQDPVGSQGVGAVPPPAVVIGGYGANAASGLHHPLLLSRPGEAVQCSTTPSLMRCDLDSCVSTGLGGAVRNRGYGVAHWRRHVLSLRARREEAPRVPDRSAARRLDPRRDSGYADPSTGLIMCFDCSPRRHFCSQSRQRFSRAVTAWRSVRYRSEFQISAID